MISIARASVTAVGVACAVVLTGCTQSRTVVAQVNNEEIPEKDYYERVLSVNTIPQGANLDAGAITMTNMIRDSLQHQLAVKMHADVSPEMAQQAAAYQLKKDPNTRAAVDSGRIAMTDLVRQKRYELETFRIGMNGDKAAEADVQQAYNDPKNKSYFEAPATFTLKILQYGDELAAQKGIDLLKRTGDFKAAAQAIGMPAAAAAAADKEQTIPGDSRLPAPLKTALDALKPLEITPKPIALTSNASSTAMPQTVYIVAQLRKKQEASVLPMNEVRFLLELMALQKTHADWQKHYQHELADFTMKSQIRIALPRYANLVDTVIRPAATEAQSGQSAPMSSPQTGAAPR